MGLGLDNLFSPGPRPLPRRVVRPGQGARGEGPGRLSLAGYLKAKAGLAAAIRSAKGPLQTKFRVRTQDETGKPVEKEFDIPPEDQAYHFHLRMGDPGGDRRRGDGSSRR